MPIAKTTATVAGVANTALLSLTQYGVRASIEIPAKKLILATHRTSSGTVRTLTLAEDHGMAIGDLFLAGGFSNASYNLSGATYHLGVVTSVPATNKLTYSMTGTLSETETAVVAGGIIRLGFKTLRIGMRAAYPRAANWGVMANAFGFGLSQGSNPVSSAACAKWMGFGGPKDASTLTYTAGPPAYTSVATIYPCLHKHGDTWGSFSWAGWSMGKRYAAARSDPFCMLIDFRASSTTATVAHMRCAMSTQAAQTKEQLLSVLKYPVNIVSSGAYQDLTLSLLCGSDILDSTAWATYANGAALYLEAFSRDPNQPMEIMDIGYSFW